MLSVKELSALATDLTILYVEDEQASQDNIKEILDLIFPNVLVASNGLEGIEIAKSTMVHIVLSDINMPKCNGIDMIQEIKKIYPQIPTILLTGYNSPEYLLQSINLSISKYLMKPIKKEKLFEALEEVFYILESKKMHVKQQLKISKNMKMIAIANLLDNLNHQWGQSLSIISTSLGTILLDEDAKVLDPKIQELLLNANNHVFKMDMLLQELFLGYEDEQQIVCINLKNTVQKCINSFNTNIKFNINIADNINFPIKIESLQHSIQNIIENAIEAIHKRDIKKGFITIEANLLDSEVLISIIDNGGGIDLSVYDELYEPYISTNHSYIGTGLGLYSVYMLITKAMKGFIKHCNIIINNQKCAKFVISLPVGSL